MHSFGKGKVVYVGTLLRGESLAEFTAWLCSQAGVQPMLATPPGVHAYERRGRGPGAEGLRLVFLTNEGDETSEVNLGGMFEDLLDGGKIARAVIPPAG